MTEWSLSYIVLALGQLNYHFTVFQHVMAKRTCTVTTPDACRQFMEAAAAQAELDPSIKRMSSKRNNLGLRPTSFLVIAKKLQYHPYHKKKV